MAARGALASELGGPNLRQARCLEVKPLARLARERITLLPDHTAVFEDVSGSDASTDTDPSVHVFRLFSLVTSSHGSQYVLIFVGQTSRSSSSLSLTVGTRDTHASPGSYGHAAECG